MEALAGIIVASLVLVVLGLVLLVIASGRRHRKAIGQNEYTIEVPKNRGYAIAGGISLAIGALVFMWATGF